MYKQKKIVDYRNLCQTQATTNLMGSNREKISIFCNSNQKKQSNEDQNQEQIQARYIYQKSSNSSEEKVHRHKERLLRKNSSRQIELILYSQQQVQRFKRERRRSISEASLTYRSRLTNQKNFSVGKSDKQQLARKKTILSQRQGEQDCKIYKDGGWSKTKIVILSNRVAFFQCAFFISGLQKIKILPSTNPSKTKNENLIKIQASNQTYLISLSLDKKSYDVPASYHIFAKLISKKLFGQNKTYLQWSKTGHIMKSATSDSYIYGNIMKKSQILGNWQIRFIVIKKDGIYSYKDPYSDASYSFYINCSSIKYIWTRFDIQDSFLVIKIKHGVFKTQFGIPIVNYQIRNGNNWLYNFYRVIPLLATQKGTSQQK